LDLKSTDDAADAASHRPLRKPGVSLLPDRLFHDLMAAGQADILVAIPTLNHAQSAGLVAQNVFSLFTSSFARERTVLLNPDGGSTDGTQAAMLAAGAASNDLVVTSFALRTVHRISTPYHGVPGRGSAIRLVFAAADLLGARAVAIVDPEATELSPADLERLLSPILNASADYVKPVLPRAPTDGPLITQLVRPLLRAAFGKRVSEPIDPLFACSGAFAKRALRVEPWSTPFIQYGLDPWLGALAALEGFRIAQVALPSGALRSHSQAPPFSEIFRQVVGSIFGVLAQEPARWLPIDGSLPVPSFGELGPDRAPAAAFDTQSFAQTYREAMDALQPVLVEMLSPATLQLLTARAGAPILHIDDALWVRTVYELLVTAARRTVPVDQIVQALQPVYLGRVSSLFDELASLDRHDALERHERLALVFEGSKPELRAIWPAAAAR
jgi:hypothetical protein